MRQVAARPCSSAFRHFDCCRHIRPYCPFQRNAVDLSIRRCAAFADYRQASGTGVVLVGLLPLKSHWHQCRLRTGWICAVLCIVVQDCSSRLTTHLATAWMRLSLDSAESMSFMATLKGNDSLVLRHWLFRSYIATACRLWHQH